MGRGWPHSCHTLTRYEVITALVSRDKPSANKYDDFIVICVDKVSCCATTWCDVTTWRDDGTSQVSPGLMMKLVTTGDYCHQEMPSIIHLFYQVITSKIYLLRGAGGSEVDFHFFVISHSYGNGSYQELFSVWKNIVPSQSYSFLKSRKYIQLHSPTVFEVQSWNLVVMF